MEYLDYNGYTPLLGYITPDSDYVVEFDNNCVININPFEESIRRFFLIMSDLEYSGYSATIEVSVKVVGAKKHSYTCKVLLGKDGHRNEDFKFASNFDIVMPNTAIKRYTNALPVDVYLKSLSSSEMPITLDFSIKINEDYRREE